MTKKKSFLKKVKKQFDEELLYARKEIPKVNRFLGNIAESATRAVQINQPRNKVDLSIKPLNNKVNLSVETRNKVALVSKPKRLAKINGNVYWDLR